MGGRYLMNHVPLIHLLHGKLFSTNLNEQRFIRCINLNLKNYNCFTVKVCTTGGNKLESVDFQQNMCHLQQRFSPRGSAQECGVTPQETLIITTGLSSFPYPFKLRFSPAFSTMTMQQSQQSVTDRQIRRDKYPHVRDLHEHRHTTQNIIKVQNLSP